MARILQKIQAQIKSIPEKVILSSMGEERDVTFRELDILSGKVCRYLRDHGIGREDFVNILLPRGVEPFIAMLGVWRAGAAFVALEEDYPPERIAFIQKDCGCKMILDRAAWAEILKCEPLEGFAAVDDHDAAFAVYTSGTTGTPKGVLHEYGNLDLIAQSVYMNGESIIDPDNHFATIAPLHFIVVILVFIALLDAGTRNSIVPFHITKNPPALVRAFVKSGVDSIFCAPSIYRLFRKIPTLRKFFVGSEPANGIWSDDPELLVYNGYCMSETAFCVTMGRLDRPNEIAPVGEPWTRLKVTLRDEEGNPVADGEPGELCVENPFVRGYINRPEETAAAFVNREFHTRDMARRLPDGQYEVIGRIDDMIKISGNRVEPAEIEAAIARVTGLQQIVACGFGEGEDAFICLYYADPVELNAAELREKLGNVLPYYMIPSHIIHLDALPRTSTGKISRRLLPKPAEEQKEYVEPENDTARALCEAMASVLGLERFSAEADFYRMGGSFVTSMEVVGACGLPGLSINHIFRGRTPNRIAAIFLAETRPQAEAEAREENLRRPCPLSQSQMGIFLECEMHEGEAVYNNPLLFRLPVDVDADRLAEAVDRTMRAHPGLFAAIVTDEDGQPAMQYQPDYAAQTICAREKIAGDAWEQRKATLVQPFFIRSERLFRIKLIETDAEKYLFMDFHHIVFDGTSMQILGAEMERALRGETIEPESWTAYDAAMAERAARQSDAWKDAREWYLNTFGEADGSALPEGDRKDRNRAFGDLRLALELSAEDLAAACQKLRTSENVLTTAAFGAVLSACAMKKEALFSTIYNGRRDPRTGRTVSMFVTTLPVLCKTGGDQTVEEYLAGLKEQLLGAMANDTYSFADLASERDVDSEVQFAWQTDLLTLPKESGLPLTREELPFTMTGSVLTAELYPDEGRLIMHIQYRADRFSESYIARFGRCFGHVLKEMTAKQRLSEVKLLDEAEERSLLALSRGETLPYDKSETWLDLFRRNVLNTPEKTAVTDCGGSWTYAELDRASDRIAAYLLQRGVTENSFVALKTGRVKAFVAAVIGVQRAGAAYVPVDPEYPEDRIAYMLEDSEAKVVLTEETIAQALEAVQPAESVNRDTPAHRAYMIYISGSTGKPKGVVQSHRSLRAFVEWRMKNLGINGDSIHAAHPSFSFDASLDDLICPLAAGGEIHILSEELRRDMPGMREYILAHHITALTLSTQMGMAMINQYPDMPLRTVMMGGEKMLPCAQTNIRLINGYGPTEFTVCSSWHKVNQEKDTGNIPIGRPVANTWSFICDPRGRLLPEGVAGELCLAGPQIAEGYWKQRELTEEKFVPCPFTGEPDERMYRTGDLARYNGDGELEFLGRIDTQVKLRGFRIELGEIETVAGRYAGITHVAAEVRNDQLMLYYTSDGKTDEAALRAFLSESLANYMVPTACIRLDEMPMTPNGKIDRKKLPAPDSAEAEAFTAPETEAEKALCAMAAEVLGTDPIGANAIMFAYQGGLMDDTGRAREQEESANDLQPALDTAKLPISVDVYPEGERYALLFEYDGRIYGREDIASFVGAFINVARNLTRVEYVREAALIGEDERAAILALSEGERLSFDAKQTWLDLFLAQAAKTPEKTAVADAESSYTYEELNRASDQVAAWLIATGVEKNHFVGVKMGRVKAFHAAVLGIHKAGAAYLPIDPEYPEERIQFMLSDSGAKVVLTAENMAGILSGKPPEEAVTPRCAPELPAYMIYTSGTTGRPKGVVIQHKALLNFVHFTRKRWAVDGQSRIALFANFVFDGSIEDVFPALTTGGTVFIVPESARHDPQEMKEYIRANRITGGFFPTQFGQLIGANEPLDLDYMTIGGEAATSVPHVRGKIFNTYGPTEFTVNATWCVLEQDKPYRNIPIGRPLDNCSAYIMDACGHLLPRGLVGELCLAGPQLALCYWNRPDLTEEKFTACSLGEGVTARVYHTGDLARYNEDGDLEYLGRIDTQVKLRGFRIELGEIENTAIRYEGITQAAEVRRDQLVLYFTADRQIEQKTLRTFLSASAIYLPSKRQYGSARERKAISERNGNEGVRRGNARRCQRRRANRRPRRREGLPWPRLAAGPGICGADDA